MVAATMKNRPSTGWPSKLNDENIPMTRPDRRPQSSRQSRLEWNIAANRPAVMVNAGTYQAEAKPSEPAWAASRIAAEAAEAASPVMTGVQRLLAFFTGSMTGVYRHRARLTRPKKRLTVQPVPFEHSTPMRRGGHELSTHVRRMGGLVAAHRHIGAGASRGDIESPAGDACRPAGTRRARTARDPQRRRL